MAVGNSFTKLILTLLFFLLCTPNFSIPSLRVNAAYPPNGDYAFSRTQQTIYDASRSRRITYDVYLPSVRSRSRPLPLVVYSHGKWSNNRESVRLLQAIAKSGAKVIAPNAGRGEGAITKARDILFLVDNVVDRDPETTFIIGFSLGAAAIMRAVEMRGAQNDIKAAIGYAPPGNIAGLLVDWDVVTIRTILILGSNDNFTGYGKIEPFVDPTKYKNVGYPMFRHDNPTFYMYPGGTHFGFTFMTEPEGGVDPENPVPIVTSREQTNQQIKMTLKFLRTGSLETCDEDVPALVSRESFSRPALVSRQSFSRHGNSQSSQYSYSMEDNELKAYSDIASKGLGIDLSDDDLDQSKALNRIFDSAQKATTRAQQNDLSREDACRLMAYAISKATTINSTQTSVAVGRTCTLNAKQAEAFNIIDGNHDDILDRQEVSTAMATAKALLREPATNSNVSLARVNDCGGFCFPDSYKAWNPVSECMSFCCQSESEPISNNEGFCFPAASIVSVKLPSGDVVQRAISDVHVGDNVASIDTSGQVVFEPILLFTHRHDGPTSGYVKITTHTNHGNANETSHIVLSSTHMIPVIDKTCGMLHDVLMEACISLKAARDVLVNDIILTSHHVDSNYDGLRVSPSLVSSIEKRLTYEGAYHPRTLSSKIIVNGIVASCELADNIISPSTTQFLLFPTWVFALFKGAIMRTTTTLAQHLVYKKNTLIMHSLLSYTSRSF